MKWVLPKKPKKSVSKTAPAQPVYVEVQEPHKNLYPYIGQLIDTPQGKGKLLQVFQSRVTVLLEKDTKCAFFLPEELLSFLVQNN